MKYQVLLMRPYFKCPKSINTMRHALFHLGATTVMLTAWQKNMTPRVTEGLLVLYLVFMYMNIGRTTLYM